VGGAAETEAWPRPREWRMRSWGRTGLVEVAMTSVDVGRGERVMWPTPRGTREGGRRRGAGQFGVVTRHVAARARPTRGHESLGRPAAKDPGTTLHSFFHNLVTHVRGGVYSPTSVYGDGPIQCDSVKR
jgi:hypothetical protein